MWPQMADQMFWPFAIKAAAERMNSLHIDTDGHTPESTFYGVNIENILVDLSHNVLSMLCSGQQTPLHGFDWTAIMGTKMKHSCISWTLSVSCQKCCTYLQPIHWTCQPTVPCCL
jgi:hypothetical protein